MVTGAGSGVGRAAAMALLRDGFTVVLVGRRADALAATVSQAGEAGSRMFAVPTNVADPASVEALFAATKEKFGRLDVLFNNAGISAPAVELDELPVEKWLEVVSINLTGSWLCARAAFHLMKTQTPKGGRIINNGSISAYAPRPNSSPYTATKHAISGLTKSLALDGRKHDIAACQIDIGNALTEMAARMANGVPQANGTIAVEPLMDVAEVGRSVAFMASMPLDANVLNLTVMATKMPFVGRG